MDDDMFDNYAFDDNEYEDDMFVNEENDEKDRDEDDGDNDDFNDFEGDEDDRGEVQGDEQEFTTTFADISRTGHGAEMTPFEKMFQTKEELTTKRTFVMLTDEFNYTPEEAKTFIEKNIKILKNYPYRNVYVLVAASRYVSDHGYDLDKDYLQDILNKNVIKDYVSKIDLILYIRMLRAESKMIKMKTKSRKKK